ncbi:MAG: hypothetical protein HY060_09970 [Proteobacteria bacterium]|nr:hypothetical protein [Pseudomonadota bacterium]
MMRPPPRQRRRQRPAAPPVAAADDDEDTAAPTTPFIVRKRMVVLGQLPARRDAEPPPVRRAPEPALPPPPAPSPPVAAAAPPAAPPAVEADEPSDGLGLFRRMFGALGIDSTTQAEAEAPKPSAPAPAAEPSGDQTTPPPPAEAPPPSAQAPAPPREVAALAPPAPARPSPGPPFAGPARPNAAACADVTAEGPTKEIDLDTVRRLLRGGDYRRGAFETNAAYRARVLAKLEGVEALAIEQTGRTDLVFSLPIAPYRMNYDADAKELWIGSELGLLRGGSAIGMGDFIVVATAERELGSHLATIAYGVRQAPGVEREVKRVIGDQLGLIMPGGSSMGWPSNFQRVQAPMTADEAAAAKDSMAVLFVARLQEPYFATGEFIQEAKLDEPVEKRLTVEAIKVAIDCAAIYDRRSGRLIRALAPMR